MRECDFYVVSLVPPNCKSALWVVKSTSKLKESGRENSDKKASSVSAIPPVESWESKAVNRN